jgi:hypothetical protein
MTTFYDDAMAILDDMTDTIRRIKALSDELGALQARLSECLRTTGPLAELKRLEGRVGEAHASLGIEV